MSRPKMNKMYCGDGFPNHPDWSDLGGGGSTYTAGDGISITSGKIAADPDGTTIGINETSKKLECLVDPGPTYTAGDGIDITEGAISADVDGTTIGINSTTKKLECLVSGGGGVDYSTTETDTGLRWIDNSTVYQKVVSVGSLTTSDTDTPHGISNLGHVISVDCVMNVTGGTNSGKRIPIPQVTFLNNSPKLTILVDDTNITTHSSANYIGDCYAILRYTKATTP